MPGTLNILNLPQDASPHLALLEVRKRSMDKEARDYAREVQEAARGVLGATEKFVAGWRAICREVVAGNTAEMQLVRDRFLTAFSAHLDYLRQGAALARYAGRAAGQELPEVGQLESDADTLERQLKEITTRWQTADDLEDLAAERVVIPEEKLEEVRRKAGFPQSWYDGASKPF